MGDDLRKRFGALVAANRRRRGLTQQELAERAEISADMLGQVERGLTGARFTTIERLAAALGVDPAELFTPDLPKPTAHYAKLTRVTSVLAGLSAGDLDWVEGVITAALLRKK